MWERLHRLDRRWVFLLVALTVIVPTIVTIPFPVPVSNATQGAYDRVERLPSGSFVILSFGYGPSSMAELQPQVNAVMRHAFRRGLRVMLLSLWPDATPLAERALREVVESDEFADPTTGTSRLVEGTNYVDVGYRQGASVVILKMAEDIPGFFGTDVRGNALATLPVMKGVRSYKDVALVIDFAAGDSVDWWVTYGNQRYGISVAAGVTGVMVSQLYPYLNSGQLAGLIGGGLGAAEYEALIHSPGAGTRRVSTLSFVHFLIIGLVILGNVLYYRERRRAPEGGRA